MNYGALAAKVRAMYGKRLRFADFEHMAQLPNVQSVLDYLRAQPGWSAAVSALGAGGYVGRIELEESLRAQLWKEYQGLSHFLPRPDRPLAAYPVRLAELEDIMTALRRLKAKGRAKPLPSGAFLQGQLQVDRKALAACTDYDGLLAAVQGSIYHAPLLHVRTGAAGGLPDYTTTEALLRSTYFSHLYRLVHKQAGPAAQKLLIRALGEQIDLLNIIHILRLKTYFPGENQYYAALFPFNYRLRPEKVRELCAAPDAQAVFTLLQDTHYARQFTGLDVAEVEDYYRRALYTFHRRALVTGAPSVYTAVSYLHLKEAELRVLVNVIESVKYGAPYDAALAHLVGQ